MSASYFTFNLKPMYTLTTREFYQNRQFSILFSRKLLLNEISVGYIIGTPVAETMNAIGK